MIGASWCIGIGKCGAPIFGGSHELEFAGRESGQPQCLLSSLHDKQIMYMNLLNILLHFLFQVYAVSMVHMNISACTCINFRAWVGDWLT